MGLELAQWGPVFFQTPVGLELAQWGPVFLQTPVGLELAQWGPVFLQTPVGLELAQWGPVFLQTDSDDDATPVGLELDWFASGRKNCGDVLECFHSRKKRGQPTIIILEFPIINLAINLCF